MKSTACPICDSPNLRFAFHMNYWKEFPLSFDTCGDCETTFANPMPSDAAIQLGNQALIHSYQQHKTGDQELREARQAYLRGKVLARRLMRWKKGGRALELGCYHGFLSLGLKENSNWDVEDVEISDKLGRFVNETLGVRCHVGLLENLKLPENSYDFIICHDLIEHINQPREFLAKISRILKPGGRIQVITPNAIQDLAFTRRLYAGGMTPTMLLNHILYFSPRSLAVALKKAGLRVKELHQYDVRYTLKDFGVFGLGKLPPSIAPAPSATETAKIPFNETMSYWTPETLEQLRKHKKVSGLYGFIKITLPRLFTWKVPPALRVGHELFAIGEK